MTMEERVAPDGKLWVCGACGKVAKDRYGIDGEHSFGWDASCMMNAVLCYEQKKLGSDGFYTWVAVGA